ncbi:MAG: DUF1801 domain-containing protein [Rubricoccaceae bacterium]|nr:DUF1801 domain-containing protein [Rubricoccaceae bacterium]
MSDLKTKPTDASVKKFLDGVENAQRKKDAYVILDLMREVTGKEPKLWGPSIVGFGSYHYVYDSGREGDWPITGFSPRKQNLTLYIMPGFDRYDDLMSKLGKHKTGKSCLYVNKLDDVDMDVLRELVEQSVKYMQEKYETA